MGICLIYIGKESVKFLFVYNVWWLGGHIMNGNEYDFLAVKRVKVTGKNGKVKNSRHLFWATIDLRDVKTRVK